VWLKAELGLLKDTLLVGRIALNTTGILGMRQKHLWNASKRGHAVSLVYHLEYQAVLLVLCRPNFKERVVGLVHLNPPQSRERCQFHLSGHARSWQINSPGHDNWNMEARRKP